MKILELPEGGDRDIHVSTMNVKPYKESGFSIGNQHIGSRALPAPLAGFSDRAFRNILREFGCQLVYTEMISADGLVRKNRQTWNILDIEGEPGLVAVQLFGCHPTALSEAAKMVEDRGASIVDMNMGCPVKKVVRSGAGAALLDQPEIALETIRAIKKAIKIPLTVKMRSGTRGNPHAALELAPLLEKEGVDAICIHPRTKEQLYAGKADWRQIAELKIRLSVPVIGNGDIHNGIDVLQMRNSTQCDAIMIGRASLGNPWIFLEARGVLGEIPYEGALMPGIRERIQTGIRHLEEMVRQKGEQRGVVEFRKHGICYLKSMPCAKEMRSQFYRMNSIEQTKEFLTNTGLR
ncbi:tRNA dihydrouridine synthase DusB [Candidatus Sumerlaeota bacterium]|nr:tRNA dihydrouridine synthase DusB [Candidatus Sumerlaeota bacterium]